MSVLRLLFFILLLLNLLALAATSGLLGRTEPRGEPERLTNQLHPERIRLLNGSPPALASAAPPPARTETPALPDLAQAATTAAEMPPDPEACLMFDGLGGDAADAVVRGFDAPAFAVRRSETEAITGWWVRIPPNGGREYAERKGRELRGMGITDFFIVQDPGPNQYAVSLGIFKTEAAARQHLAQLGTRGVRSARLGTRNATTYRIEVRGPRTQLDNRLNTLTLPGGTRPQDCPAA